jgi:acetylornithine deacetylase/succinyl-diaminopimelate desuccinylase-like protein
MKYTAFLAIPLLALAASAQTSNLAEMNTRLRTAETNDSQVMWILHELTDVHGPRLTGSPGLRNAQDWVVTTMKSWGLVNVKLEPWNFNHQGWQNYELSANVIKPFQQPLNVRAVAWTPGTNGTVEGQVLVVIPPTPPPAAAGQRGGGRGAGGNGPDLAAIARAGTSPAPMPPATPAPAAKPVMQADLDAYLASIKPKLRGAIVFYGAHATVAENFVPAPLRNTDEVWDNRGRGGGRGQPAAAAPAANAAVRPQGLTAQQIAQQLNRFLIANGALAKVTDAGRAYGIIAQQSSAGYNEDPDNPNLPSLLMSNEDYGRIYRTVTEDKLTVTIRLNIRNEFYPQGNTVYNVVGELPGTDKADEVVMLGGHFDSWNAATGATDNAAGSAMALEAIRLLKTVGARPRRTIRVALWSGEEEGLYGSLAYVAEHFGSAENPKPEYFKFNGYLNIDSGTGKPRAASVFGPADAANMVQDAMDFFKDWGFTRATPTLGRNTGGTDSTSFNNAGLPGIGFNQDPFDYNTYTHHTNFDTYERIYEPDVREAAVEEALAAYGLASTEQMLPRCSAATMPTLPPEPRTAAPTAPSKVPVTPVRQFYGPPLAAGQTAPPAPTTCTASVPAASAPVKR